MTTACSKCGAPGTGKFCAHCGTPLTGGGVASGAHRVRWAIGVCGLLVAVLLVLVVRREKSQTAATAAGDASAPPAAPTEAGTPPDISSMTPRERFDRLYNRVMSAAETGDTATVARFTPMVFAAYDQLDSVDADARYHAAVLQLHIRGDSASALRLADSILGSNPHHLFGFLIRGTAAQLAGDTAMLARARKSFLEAWDAEMKAGRPEYKDHQTMLEQFHSAALKAGGKNSS